MGGSGQGGASVTSAGGGQGGSGGVGGQGGIGGTGGGTPGEELANVVVHAGDFDRDHTIVSFAYPEATGQVLALRDSEGVELPVQVDAAGVATFILPALGMGAEAQFTLVRPVQSASMGATAEAVAGAVQLNVGGSRVAEFVTSSRLPAGVDGSNSRTGYLYPVYTPNGVLVTDDYPPDDEIEEMHLHHHGTWGAWTRTQFNGHEVDFWNPWGQGRVDLEYVDLPWQGPVHSGVAATLTHEDIGEGAMALTERWVVRVYSTHIGVAPYFVFDLESTQQAVNAPLRLETYHYGGFAVRGAREWRGGKFQFITSEGDTGQPDENIAPRANWVHLGGQVGGQTAGYALLGHPSNYCAPQGLRLHPTDPYFSILPVAHEVCEPFDIVPGTPYVSRFRLVTSDGPANTGLLERLWHDYATPPEVTVTRR